MQRMSILWLIKEIKNNKIRKNNNKIQIKIKIKNNQIQIYN